MQTIQFCYPYAYGMMESYYRGLAADMVFHGVITLDQAEKIQAFVEEKIDFVEKESAEYIKQKLP